MNVRVVTGVGGPPPMQRQIKQRQPVSERWLQEARAGRISFSEIMSNQDRIPEDVLDEVVAACPGRPTF